MVKRQKNARHVLLLVKNGKENKTVKTENG